VHSLGALRGSLSRLPALYLRVNVTEGGFGIASRKT